MVDFVHLGIWLILYGFLDLGTPEWPDHDFTDEKQSDSCLEGFFVE